MAIKPTQSKAAPKPTTKTGGKSGGKSGGMDSDDKTLTMLVGGLFGVLALIGGVIGAYSYFTPEKSKGPTEVRSPAASASLSGIPQSSTSAEAPQGLAQARTVSTVEAGAVFSNFDPATQYEPGEVVLADPPQGFEDKIRPLGFRITEHIRLTRLSMSIVRVTTPQGMSVPDAIRIIGKELPGVTVDANNRFDGSAGANIDQTTSNPRALAGWEDLSPTCGKGLVLGQIDSGVDLSHPALQGRDITYQSFTKPGRRPGPPDHGTSVAGILVGNPEWGGLVPGAKLYAANMFELDEQGNNVGSAVGLLQAIDWIMQQNVNAVNMSIAGGDNDVVRKAFAAAKRQNVIMVAAVGNWGSADKPAYPAAYNDVVAVTAIKGGELIYSHANTGDYVDFAAPGVGIYTAVPGGGGKLQSGTSFATPFITVMAAILAKAGKTPDADTLINLLGRATRDLGKPGKDSIFGQGSVKAKPVCQE